MPRLRPCFGRGLGAMAAVALLLLQGRVLAEPASSAPTPAPTTPSQLAALQAALNTGGEALEALLSQGPGVDPALVELRRRALVKQFPDASWTLTPGPKLRDGRSTVELRLKGTHTQGGSTFRLEGSQQLALATSGGRVVGQTVLREQTVVSSGQQELPVTLQIPDAVLTGQRYDLDVVIDEPLDGAVIAGGLMALTSSQTKAMETPRLELGALGGGGLFKTVQAPYTPGEQTWAVLLVHPKGIVTATKRVRVVADRSQLNP